MPALEVEVQFAGLLQATAVKRLEDSFFSQLHRKLGKDNLDVEQEVWGRDRCEFRANVMGAPLPGVLVIGPEVVMFSARICLPAGIFKANLECAVRQAACSALASC